MGNVQKKSSHGATCDKNEANAPRGPLILIADGSAGSRETMAVQLGQQDYRTLTVESGSAALMMLRSEQPALLLLDQNMPGLSGIDLLREMRGNKDTAMLPVIIMTKSPDPSLTVAALHAGADDHIVMPADFGALAARIERQLERAREICALRHAATALDARLIRRALEIEELQTRIETLCAEKAALSTLLGGRSIQTPEKSVKPIAAA